MMIDLPVRNNLLLTSTIKFIFKTPHTWKSNLFRTGSPDSHNLLLKIFTKTTSEQCLKFFETSCWKKGIRLVAIGWELKNGVWMRVTYSSEFTISENRRSSRVAIIVTRNQISCHLMILRGWKWYFVQTSNYYSRFSHIL